MQIVESSFRDNAGFVFKQNKIYYRAINENYIGTFNQFIGSGLYQKLVDKKIFIDHKQVHLDGVNYPKIIEPTQLPFISYAYEWSFSMLQDAALCTLQNALTALEHDFILKDANTHNIQFYNGKAILIDSLSFEQYEPNTNWIAYRQFCECFLAPLLLMQYCNASLNKLMIAYPNGIPLDVCYSMLPRRAKLNLNVFLHIGLAAKMQSNNNTKTPKKTAPFTKQKLVTLLKGLQSFVQSRKLTNSKTTWDDYYTDTILSKNYFDAKQKLVTQYLNKIEFNTLLDLGANDGAFSIPFANSNKTVIAVDEDVNCIERLYNICKQNKIKNIYTVINNLTTPTPALGWHHTERLNITDRLKPDVTMALALIHHLAIANNIPLQKIIEYFYSLSKYLIIEFVAKEDEKVKQLLQHRKDIFDNYTLNYFEESLEPYYTVLEKQQVGTEHRVLFLLQKR